LDDLDPIALDKARRSFIKKHANSKQLSEADVLSWSLQTFLERSRLIHKGQITRAALVLLGKRESASFLNPHPVEMTWRLMGEERAYEHFGPPFFVNSTELYRKIRNFQIKLHAANSLIPIEIPKYEQ